MGPDWNGLLHSPTMFSGCWLMSWREPKEPRSPGGVGYPDSSALRGIRRTGAGLPWGIWGQNLPGSVAGLAATGVTLPESSEAGLPASKAPSGLGP